MSIHYEPTKDSVSKHPVPDWYDDYKFGIFIHWGLFSVPGWAFSEKGKSITDLQSESDPFASFKRNPYAEWYLNSLRIAGSPTQKFHAEHYGADFNYYDFKKEFEAESAKMDPEAWADLFQKSGAGYAVLVTKHHDGYCLWPTENPNPFLDDYCSKRDLVGELTEAVRAKGLKMGLYYSGIFDWTFKNQNPIDSAPHWIDHYMATDDYAKYSLAQTKELIRRYKPSVLWNDMGYPAQCDLDELFAYYYNTVPDGVLDDRWIQRDGKGLSCEEYTEQLEAQGEKIMDITGEIRGDFATPEYAPRLEFSKRKWELTRGIGMSFGYNREEDPDNFMKSKEIIYTIVDCASKNGNLLLNIGPRADGSIQEEQSRPLLETGQWLKENGEAIYHTTYYSEQKQGDVTGDGKTIAYTRNDTAAYAIVLDESPSQSVLLPADVAGKASKITLVGGSEEALRVSMQGNYICVTLPDHMPVQPAYSLKLSM